MKKRILVLLFLITFVLTGCKSSEEIKEETAEEKNTNTQPEENIEEDILIKGKYFNLKLPKEWEDK